MDSSALRNTNKTTSDLVVITTNLQIRVLAEGQEGGGEALQCSAVVCTIVALVSEWGNSLGIYITRTLVFR